MRIRVGFGYDVHKLEKGNDFYLGGIKIKHIKGAIGHSDADVLIHSIIDALLGAANLGDIGHYFPDTNPKFKNIDSKKLLKEVIDLLNKKKYHIINIDSTISLQNPKISNYIPDMKTTLAKTMGMTQQDISIKATTTERLGFVGQEKGVAAQTVVSIQQV